MEALRNAKYIFIIYICTNTTKTIFYSSSHAVYARPEQCKFSVGNIYYDIFSISVLSRHYIRTEQYIRPLTVVSRTLLISTVTILRVLWFLSPFLNEIPIEISRAYTMRFYLEKISYVAGNRISTKTYNSHVLMTTERNGHVNFVDRRNASAFTHASAYSALRFVEFHRNPKTIIFIFRAHSLHVSNVSSTV